MSFDVSTAAAIQQDGAPTNASDTGTPTTVVSMYQTNSVALKGTRAINWHVAETGAVAVLNGAGY